MRGLWQRKDALKILVLPLRRQSEKKTCLFVAVNDYDPSHSVIKNNGMRGFLDDKAKEFRGLTLHASNLSKRDYEQALGFFFFFFFFLLKKNDQAKGVSKF